MSAAYARFVARLDSYGCKRRGRMWTCPAHEDSTPSLSVTEGRDGRVLVRCFGGCETARVVVALGLGLRDLFDGPPPRDWKPAPPPARLRCRIGLPTDDDVFWRQPDDVIDAYFARLLGSEAPS